MTNYSIYKNKESKRIIEEHYNHYLKSLPFDAEHFFIDTRFGKTHVLCTGPSNGKPLFILQGGNCINPMTLSWFSPLAENYRIYAPDTIGHPGYSDENRLSAKDESFAHWISQLMDYFNIESSAFVGPSYGGGIILRLAAFAPERISCSVLVSPAGIQLGSKWKMIQKILFPLMLFKITSSEKYLQQIANVMSDNSMKKMDQQIIGDIFKKTKLEQEMPKLTEKKELLSYSSPTLIIAGRNDIFFPSSHIQKKANEIIPNLIAYSTYEMGHFPSERHLQEINKEIEDFLKLYY